LASARKELAWQKKNHFDSYRLERSVRNLVYVRGRAKFSPLEQFFI